MQHSSIQIQSLAPFVFRIESHAVVRYRAALRAAGDGIPLGMAMQALTSAPVASALREFSGGRIPLHVGQSYRQNEPLRAGVDYSCEVTISVVSTDRLHIEQHLRDATERICLTLASDVVMVAS